MAKRGRPTDFTPETRKIILDALRTGMGRKGAANLARIQKSTLHLWLAKGRAAIAAGKPDGFSEFMTDLEMAEAEVEKRCAKVVLEDALIDGDRESAWKWLRVHRRWREPPARTEQHIKLAVEKLSDRELDEQLARAERAEAALTAGARPTKKRSPRQESG